MRLFRNVIDDLVMCAAVLLVMLASAHAQCEPRQLPTKQVVFQFRAPREVAEQFKLKEKINELLIKAMTADANGTVDPKTIKEIKKLSKKLK
jgi:hypothetical protein